MNIFVEASVYGGEYQGALTYLRELYKEFVKNNPSSHIIFGACNIDAVKLDFSNFDNVSFYKYKSKSKVYRLIWEIPRFLRNHNVDYAHFQYLTPFYKVKGCQYINTIHDVLFLDYRAEFSIMYILLRKYFFIYSSFLSKYVLTVSEYSKERLVYHFGLSPQKIFVTPNGVSEEYIKFDYSKEESRKIIETKFGFSNFFLYVSRIEKRKRQKELVDWFKRSTVASTGTKLVIVGNDTLGCNFEEVADSCSSVYWLPSVGELDLKHLYNSANLFVYPSVAEGFGIPPLEAAVSKTPVICSSSTAMADFEFFKPFLLDFSDGFDILDQFVDEALKNDVDFDSISSRISERYSWKRSAAILKGVFDES